MPRKVHYIKSPNLVELPMHGAYGGVNVQSGQFALSVFSERAPLPKSVEFTESENGEGTEQRCESKDGIIRNVTATLYFDINTALNLHDWLDDKIQQFQDENPDLFESAPPVDESSEDEVK